MAKFEIKYISSLHCYLVEFEEQKDLSYAMMRFQEYYESPKFRGKVFKRKEFEHWYKTTYDKDYYKEWEGFNFPGQILFEVIYGFSPLEDCEKAVVDALLTFDDVISSYIIGTCKDNNVFDHELAHAIYFSSVSYREKVNHIVLTKMLDGRLEEVLKALEAMSYVPHFWLDEVQAYFVDGFKYLEEESEYINSGDYKDVVDMVNLEFKIYKDGIK